MLLHSKINGISLLKNAFSITNMHKFSQKRHKNFLFISLSLIFILNSFSLASCFDTSKLGEHGRVTYVVDGDTFDVEGVDRIRLADIDCAEMGTFEGQIAKDYVSGLINQEVVYLDIDDIYQTGYYGRYIAVVYIPHNSTHLKNLNQLLLKEGYAVAANYDNEFNPTIWINNPMEYILIPSSTSDPPSDSPTYPSGSSSGDGPSSSPNSYVLIYIFSVLMIGSIGIYLYFAYCQEFLEKKGIKLFSKNTKKDFSHPSAKKSPIIPKISIKTQIIQSLKWGPWKKVNTNTSTKFVRNAPPTSDFWEMWKSQKSQIKTMGFSVSNWNGSWQVSQWKDT